MIAMVMLLILGGAWVFVASEFFQHAGEGGRILGRADMWVNAFAHLPNMSAVIGYVFKNHLWLPVVVIVGEVLALGFGLFMKKLKRDLNSPRRK